MNEVAYVGQVLADKYRVDRVLGVGGMGVVVAAHHLELDSKVAIKFLLPETLANPEAVARFAREARAAVRIRSEHVARVSDVGKLDTGAPYMVMEYLEGLDLSGWLSERGPLPAGQAVEFTLQACEAIAEAHALGIVHRDLKPANLFVIKRPDGGLSIKVLDFGISKSTSLGGSGGEGSMTKTSTMLGSPLYMSPEQIQSSKDVDARSDIWALGVILYELMTGSTPFGGEHMAELIFAIISAQPAPLRSRRADVPDGLDHVVARCLAKNRAERFGSIAELANALAPFAPPRALTSVERITGVSTGMFPAQHATVAINPAASADTSAPYAAAGTQASWGNTNQRSSTGAQSTAASKSRAPLLGLGLGAAGVLLLGAWLGVRSLSAKDATVAASSAAAELAPSVHAEPPKPEPVTAATTTTAAPAEAASAPASASAAASGAVPLASSSAPARAKSPPKTKTTPPLTPPGSHDMWGGSQH